VPLGLPTGCCEARISVATLLAGRTPEAAAAALGLALPASLAAAVPSRRAEYLAGRWCARSALGRAGLHPPAAPAIGPERAPEWPAGYVGAISHSQGEAWAVVAQDTLLRGIGIDLERALEATAARELEPVLRAPGEELPEVAGNGGEAWSAAQRLALLFSAKESLYKCVAPLGGSGLGFADARLLDCDGTAGTLRLELLRSAAPGLPRGLRLPGGFALEQGHVRTWVGWPRDHGQGPTPGA
jgi:enterobactin synthetase component D